MIYKLEFREIAFKEWRKLAPSIREQFKKRLDERLKNPHVESARLYGDLAGCYKIKLKTVGYRLIYQVNDTSIVVTVIAVGKRDKSFVYEVAKKRL